MASVLPHTARQFARAIVMPNLKPPVTTAAPAIAAYRERILAALPAGMKFEPLMTLYLTDNTPPDEIRRAQDSGFVHAVKLYPAGATTNSDAGVTDLRKCYKTLEMMQEVGMPLPGARRSHRPRHRPVRPRSRVHRARDAPAAPRLPGVKIVFEHITTKHAAQYVAEAEGPIAATITAHHLLYNRNEIFKGGIRPALLLPAGAEARRTPPGAGHGRHQRRRALLPRHRLGAARAGRQGKPPAAAPAATPRCTRWSCTPKPSNAPARWTSWKPSPA
jgi:dihydroorotase